MSETSDVRLGLYGQCCSCYHHVSWKRNFTPHHLHLPRCLSGHLWYTSSFLTNTILSLCPCSYINKCHPQQNFLPSFLNFIFDCPKIWLDWSKEKHWFNKIEATRIPSIECKDSLLKGMVCCGVTSILCCMWVSEYFAIDLSIYFGYCHLPSSKASIKSLQQCLLKIHVLVVWLLVFLILSVVIFFGAFLHELSKWPALQGYFFHQVNSFAWWKQYTVVLYIRFIPYSCNSYKFDSYQLIW